AVGQPSDHLIDMPDRLTSFWRLRSIRVSRMVCVRVVQSDEMRSPLRWKPQPRDDLLDAFLVGKLVVEPEVVAGPFPLYLRFRTRPEETCRSHSLLFRQHPQGRPSIPAPVT